MNIQAMMKQAQKMQKDMMEAKDKIDNQVFIGKASLVTATLKGTKEIEKIKIEADEFEKEDLEMLEDMIVVAINDAIRQIDIETESKMGKFTQGMPGLF